MNYAAALLCLIFAAALSFWAINGKYYYTGPIVEAQKNQVINNLSEDGLRKSPFKHTEV